MDAWAGNADVGNIDVCDIVTCASPQAIQIGDEIEVAVLSVEGGQVRLGITAPGRRLMTIDPVPLPSLTADGGRFGRRYGMQWPKARGE